MQQKIVSKKIGKEITKFVHGEEELKKAIETTEKLFSNQHAPAENLTYDDLEGMEGIIKFDFEKDKIERY